MRHGIFALRGALAAAGLALALVAGGCSKPSPAADRFPGFTPAGAPAAQAKWFVDLASVVRQSGVVTFKAVRLLDTGYAIQQLETDCQAQIAGREGVRFKEDGTTDRTFEADSTAQDVQKVPGAPAVVKLVCDKAEAGRVIAGDFDDAKAMYLLFGNYSADKAAIWKNFSSKSADTQFLNEGGAPIVHVALSTQFVEAGITKHMLVTTATPNVADYSCHACGVLLGAFVFANSDGKWHVERELPYFLVRGSWGKAPELSLLKLADATTALHVESGFMGQGILSTSHELFSLAASAEPFFEYSVEGDSESHNPTATIEALPTASSGLADVRVNVVWSGVEASAPSSNEQIVYKFDGHEYQRATPAAVAPAASAASGSV
jgi:hypothetical protein